MPNKLFLVLGLLLLAWLIGMTGFYLGQNSGVIFTTTNITETIANDLIKNPPKFVGLSKEFEFDLAIEKLLLEHKIISFENLANTAKLPPKFEFIGLPLKLRGGDGSPVRAVAVVP